MSLKINKNSEGLTYDKMCYNVFRIHQCSSRQLISVFPHGEGIANVELAMQEPSSPKLPPSVSQSRGKTYRSREWGQINSGVVANKRNPVQNLSSKSSRVNLGSGQTMKTKPSNGPRGNAKTKPNSVCKSSLTGMSGPKYPNPSSIVRDSKTSSSSGAIKEEYQSVSTITSENSENKQQKLLEVSSQAVSHTNGLLSALKITLRKSCATRQASRAERDGGRQSEGCKSSSGKSSVGSSSHPGYYVKNKTLPASQNKDITPDSRNVMRAPQATTDKVKMPSMSKDSTAKNQDLISKPRGGCKTVAAAKSTHLENAKSKVRIYRDFIDIIISQTSTSFRLKSCITVTYLVMMLRLAICNPDLWISRKYDEY